MSTYTELQAEFIARAKTLLDGTNLSEAATTDLLLAGALLKQLDATNQLNIKDDGTLSAQPRSQMINKSFSVNGSLTQQNQCKTEFTVPAGVTELFISAVACGGEGGGYTAPASAKKWFKSAAVATGQIGASASDGIGGFQFNVLPATGVSGYVTNYNFTINTNLTMLCNIIPRFSKASPSGKLIIMPSRGYAGTGYYGLFSVRNNYGKEVTGNLYGRQSTPAVTDATDSIVVDDNIAAYTTGNGIVWTNDGWATSHTAALSDGPTQFEYANNNSYCRRIRYFDGKLVTAGKSITSSYTNNYVLSVDVVTGVVTTNLITTDTNAVYDIGYNGTAWVATGLSGKVWYGSNLSGTWTAATIASLSTNNVYTVEVGGATSNTFMIGAASGLAFSSTNGSDWTQRSTGLNQTIREYCLMYHPELDNWYATDNNSTTATAGSLKVASGSDLSVWNTAASLDYGANYVYYGYGGHINVLTMSTSALKAKFSTDGTTFAEESFTNTDFTRGGKTVVLNESGEELMSLVGGEYGSAGCCRGGSSYTSGSVMGTGEGGLGGIGVSTSTTDVTILNRNPSTPRAGYAYNTSSQGSGVAVSVVDLPAEGWQLKLAGGGGGYLGETYSHGGGGSCFGTGGGNRVNIHQPATGPGSGASKINSSGAGYSGGAGEGCWRYRVYVTPGETLELWPGVPVYASGTSGFLNLDLATSSSGVYQAGMIILEWKE